MRIEFTRSNTDGLPWLGPISSHKYKTIPLTMLEPATLTQLRKQPKREVRYGAPYAPHMLFVKEFSYADPVSTWKIHGISYGFIFTTGLYCSGFTYSAHPECTEFGFHYTVID